MTTPPPKTTAQEKGDSLERAVETIERAILRSAPGFTDGTFKIQSKRVVRVEGVRHEIDLYVTAALPSGYEAIFIFECKNWEAKVGKNEIIVFSEKIAATAAQRGFFVARAFTKDARAQAARDSRVRLLLASHVKPVVNMQFPQIVQTHIGATSVHVRFGLASARAEEMLSDPLVDTHILRIGAVSAPPQEYVNRWAEQVRREHASRLPPDTPDGNYTVPLAASQQFAEGEAFLDDVPLRQLELTGTAEVAVAHAQVLSIFDVESRGRVLKVGVDLGGLELRANVVEIPTGGAQ